MSLVAVYHFIIRPEQALVERLRALSTDYAALFGPVLWRARGFDDLEVQLRTKSAVLKGAIEEYGHIPALREFFENERWSTGEPDVFDRFFAIERIDDVVDLDES